MDNVHLVRADGEALWQVARRLIEEYAGSLGVSLEFQGIGYELDHLASAYGPPGGALLLARQAGPFVGCGAIRRLSSEACEMKRLYVSPASQGGGIGQTLARGLIDEARRLGYRQMLLDTLPSMQKAQALYRSLGFRDTEPYRFNPVPGTAYLRLDL